MADYGITFEDRYKMAVHFISKLKIPLQELNRQELEKAIETFLKNRQCLSLGTVNPDGTPHQTILDYVSNGLKLYMASEGGQKFRALEHSNKVSVTIGFSGGTVESEYGLTMDGTAKIYKAPHPKYVAGMLKMKNFVMEWSRSVQPVENILSKAINTRLIEVTPYKMTYLNMPEGIPISRWVR